MKSTRATSAITATEETREHVRRTASKTTATTMMSMIISHSLRRPALRWYSCAVVSSSAADDVWTPTEVMLLSILSEGVRRRRQLLNPFSNSTGRHGWPDVPTMPPCSTTSAPRSRKMSFSSWMPLSISRISVSRSFIWASWKSSSCAGIVLKPGQTGVRP